MPAQALIDAAEQAIVAGRLEEARGHLLDLQRMGERHAFIHHMHAMVEQRLGNPAEAVAQFEQAAALAPDDSQLAINQGNLLLELCRPDEALRCYERALMHAPMLAPAMFNRALALQQLGRMADARQAFRAMAAAHPGDSSSWVGIGTLERAAGNLAAAAEAFDEALARQPGDRAAASQRARVALERVEPDVIARYESAVRLSPDDRALLLDEAVARAEAGVPDPLRRLGETVRANPQWAAGQVMLARLRWELGEKERFREGIEAELSARPDNSELWSDYTLLLSECRLHEAAADAAARAHGPGIDKTRWLLAEAIHRGRAGDLDRAEELFEALPVGMPGRAAHEAVHWLRRGDYRRSLVLAEQVLEENRWNISTWSLIEVLWRKLGDARAEWLSGQPGLIGSFDTPWDEDIAAVDAWLARLHRDSVECAGQSVRDGTQTRWSLFDRADAELPPLRARLDAMVQRYMAQLPAKDETHPLLRHRDAPMRITASWSVRLTGMGCHVSHFHPEGLVSSAFYLRVPEADRDKREGWLELGVPPDDYLMDLPPIAAVEPRPGRLALFPSYLMHGTRPFPAGERMTVAFDVARAES